MLPSSLSSPDVTLVFTHKRQVVLTYLRDQQYFLREKS
jgi:hypothetical protein